MSNSRISFTRVYAIHDQIRNGRFPNSVNIAETIGISSRSVKRMIAAMRDQLKLPIEYSYTEKGYFYSDAVENFPVFEVSKNELASLFLLKSSLKSIEGSQLAYSMQSICSKLTEQLEGKSGIRMEDLDLAFSRSQTQLRVGLLERLGSVSHAMLERKSVKFEYKKLYSQEHEARKVDPLHLREVESCWYLLAYDHAREAVRTFSLPRMRNVDVQLATSFKIPDAFKESLSKEESFGSWVDTDEALPVKNVIIRLSGYAATQAMERVWHHSQDVQPLDASAREVDVTFKVRDYHELVRWVLSFGRHARVIAPHDFKQTVREEFKAMQHG